MVLNMRTTFYADKSAVEQKKAKETKKIHPTFYSAAG